VHLAITPRILSFLEFTLITVTVLTGPPGSGKSTQMMHETADEPAKYIWACPIIDLIVEQSPRLRELAPDASVMEIHGEAKLKGSVGKAIAGLPSLCAANEHVVALVTHEGLLDADPAAFAGWHVRIDETPNSIGSGVFKISRSVDLLRAHYALETIDMDGWSRVSPLVPEINWSHLKGDDFAAKLTNFHKLAGRKSGLFVNITNWDQARTQQVEWISVWTPAELAGCASVTFTGAGYFGSLTHKVTEVLYGDEVKFIRRPANNSVRSGQPKVRLHYFCDAHIGTTTFWSQSEGRWPLVKICDWLTDNVPNLGYWSGNEIVQVLFDHRVAGEAVKPKAAGLNRLRHHRSCAYLYSSKPVSADAPLMSLFGMTKQQIMEAREHEDIVQFVYRGAIRDPAYSGDYDVYLYHRDQAVAVADAMRGYGLHDIEIVAEPGAGLIGWMPAGQCAAQPKLNEAERKERKSKQNRDRQARFRRRRKLREFSSPPTIEQACRQRSDWNPRT